MSGWYDEYIVGRCVGNFDLFFIVELCFLSVRCFRVFLKKIEDF